MTRREEYELALETVAKYGMDYPHLQTEFARAKATFTASKLLGGMRSQNVTPRVPMGQNLPLQGQNNAISAPITPQTGQSTAPTVNVP